MPDRIDSPLDDLAGTPITESDRRMRFADLVLILCSVSLAAVAQLMLKHGMKVAVDQTKSGGSIVAKAVTSPSIVGGLALFGVSAVLWLAALRRVPLSRAYPFNALAYVGILVSSVFVLHEHVSPARWLGAGLVVVGLVLVVSS
jgi:drug/metabolite transporter (DMT)-like permease